MSQSFIRKDILAIHGYTPGEQPRGGERVVKLNTNENPYPPSPRVLDAIRLLDGESLRKYPDPTATRFRIAAGKLHGVTPDQILCGNGSDDLLTIATRAVLTADTTLAVPWPTYSLYETLSQLQGCRFHTVPWQDGWLLPTDALLAARPRAIYLANPNSPSGTLVPETQLRDLAERLDGLLLIDEAYADFSGNDAASLTHDLSNVLVTRTLSKGYSLAGLRFGYGIGHAWLIEQLMKVKDSYNCDALSIAAAVAAIEDQPYAADTWQRVIEERTRVTESLVSLGVSATDSRTNFILADVPDAGAVHASLRKQGILVRHFDRDGLRDKLRITIGTPAENDAFLAAMSATLAGA